MARKLSLKHRKTRRKKAKAARAGKSPTKRHKVAAERSKKARTKNAYRA